MPFQIGLMTHKEWAHWLTSFLYHFIGLHELAYDLYFHKIRNEAHWPSLFSLHCKPKSWYLAIGFTAHIIANITWLVDGPYQSCLRAWAWSPYIFLDNFSRRDPQCSSWIRSLKLETQLWPSTLSCNYLLSIPEAAPYHISSSMLTMKYFRSFPLWKFTRVKAWT